MDLTTNISDLKLLSKLLQRHEKITSIHDHSVPLLTKKYFFIKVVYESPSNTL